MKVVHAFVEEYFASLASGTSRMFQSIVDKCTKALRTVRVKNYQSSFHRTAPTGLPPILRTSLPLLGGPVKCKSSITFSYCNMQVVFIKELCHELFIM